MGINTQIDNLMEAAKQGKLPHAILLEGENLENSFEISKKIIKTLFCRNILNDLDKIKVIHDKIDKCIHPDVFILECEGKSKTVGVNQVRDLKQTVYIKPNESFYKVYIVKDASTLTVQSQNALLKILEEPPCYTIFILICKSSEILLDTVNSRVQKFFVEGSNTNDITLIADDCKKVIESILSKKEINIMKSTSKFIKDRKYFKDSICYIIDVFSNAVLVQNNIDISCEYDVLDICKKISINMSKNQILKFIELLKYICFLLESNVNVNLIASYLLFRTRELVIL